MEFLILAGALVVGFYAGWVGRERYAMRTVLEILEQAAAQEEQETEEVRDRLSLERHGEVIYAYTTEGEFIGQGNDLFALDEAIQKRFPGRKFLIKKENLEEVGAAHEHL
jgi:hypothetical protein